MFNKIYEWNNKNLVFAFGNMKHTKKNGLHAVT